MCNLIVWWVLVGINPMDDICIMFSLRVFTDFMFLQGKFIRIHFGTTGKLSSADIETCKFAFT